MSDKSGAPLGSAKVTAVQKTLKNLVESDAFQALDSLGNMAFDIACNTNK